MVVKPLDDIIGQSTTETMNKMVEQMIQMVAPVKTTAWGGCHRSLTLVLDDADYSSITKVKITSTMPVTQPGAINKVITDTSTYRKKPRNSKRNMTFRRQPPTLASNVLSTASRRSMSNRTQQRVLRLC